MNMYKMFEDVSHFLSGALARIFGPTDDSYPETGVQPFDGDPYKESNQDW